MVFAGREVFQCPQCSQMNYYTNYKITHLACSKCNIAYSKSEDGFTWMKITNNMPEDMSPLKVGAMGYIGDIKIDITGRIRYEFKEGYRNHWMAVNNANEFYWIVEAYGTYAWLKYSEVKIEPSKLLKFKPGSVFEISGKKHFHVNYISNITGFFIEGEIALPFQPVDDFITLEMSNPWFEMVIVDAISRDKIFASTGKYQEFDDFKFSNTRLLDEWI
ncbi:MAG: hypothetical protein ACK40G_06950 [Cytophagaceae bacterium]